MKKLACDFTPFFETLKEKNLSRTRFKRENHFSAANLSHLRNNRNMYLSTIVYLLELLDESDIGKIVAIRVIDDNQE